MKVLGIFEFSPFLAGDLSVSSSSLSHLLPSLICTSPSSSQSGILILNWPVLQQGHLVVMSLTRLSTKPAAHHTDYLLRSKAGITTLLKISQQWQDVPLTSSSWAMTREQSRQMKHPSFSVETKASIELFQYSDKHWHFCKCIYLYALQDQCN